MESDAKKQRRRIMAEIHQLEIRAENGEEIADSEFQKLGQKLADLDPRSKQKQVRASRKDARLTKDVVKDAKERGINTYTLYYRVYSLGMDVEEAINKPVRKKRILKSLEESGLTVQKFLFCKHLDKIDEEIAEEFGIGLKTLNEFKHRNKLLHNDLMAMKQPKPLDLTQKQFNRDEHGRRIIPKNIFDLAEKNGIGKGTVYTRINLNWEFERIVTQPVNKRKSRKQKKEGA